LKQALVLFAHGSRDPQWARPFEQIAARLADRFSVKLAYLEQMRPSLDEAVASLAASGARAARVVPLFLGAGGHVKDDLPRLVADAQRAHGVQLTLEQPIGEQPAVIAAIADALGG
jgi:sirohydrochlorin cobaltochelatase